MSNIINNKRIAKNSVLLTSRLIITMCISLYTSRVVLNVLGVEDYGIYNVVGGFVAIFSSLTDSLSRAFSRFMTVAIAKEDILEQRKVFSANINILLLLIVVIVFLSEFIGMWYLGSVVNVPEEKISIINPLFQFSLLSFVFGLSKIPFISIIIAHEKSGIYALLGILDSLLKLIIVYLLAISDNNKLVIYAGLFALVTFLSMICAAFYCWLSFKGCRYVRGVAKDLYRTMFGFASWSFVGLSARVFNAQSVVLIVNKYCGVLVNAAIGIVTQVEGCTRQFISNIAVAVYPQIVKSYAIGDVRYMQKLIIFSSKCFCFTVLLYAIPISIEAEYILYLWLGMIPEYTVELLRLTFLGSLFVVMASPLEVAAQASGNIKKLQLNTSLVLLLALPLVWLLLFKGLQLKYVYLFLVFVYIVVDLVQFVNTRRVTQLSTFNYIFNVMFRIIVTTVISTLAPLYIIYKFDPSFLRLCGTCIVSLISTSICFFIIGFSRNELKIMFRIIKSFCKKNNHQ